MTYVFPTSYFAPTPKGPWLSGRVISAGQSVAGPVQTVKTDGGGVWAMEFSGIALWDRAKLLGWRAFEALFDGGAEAVVVPLCDLRQAPVPIVGGRPYYGADLPHTDNTVYSDDGSGYGADIIDAENDGAAALRAVDLTIVINDGGDLLAGMHFSVDHSVAGRRLYRVATIVTDHGAGRYDVKIRPPLREAIADATALDFQRPGCLMMVTNPEEIAATVEGLKFGSAPTIKFMEAPW